jgi:hypothetical protein
MISQELLNELQLIFKEDFGVVLSISEIKEIAITYINYFDLLAKLKSEKCVINVEKKASTSG